MKAKPSIGTNRRVRRFDGTFAFGKQLNGTRTKVGRNGNECGTMNFRA
ncbi:MAG: hypothetical protein ACTS68_01230 [Candidatus Hodgkinia cicadicola]